LAPSPARRALTSHHVAAAVDPAVVDINTDLGEGTGIIVTPRGEIMTNNHVVAWATTISVSILDRGTYSATVIGTDTTADVAVLQLRGVSGLPTVKFGHSSDIHIGSFVVAIGNVGGEGFPSAVTSGLVTALGRTIVATDDTGPDETLTGMIEMDALIQPGNSGGPLMNASGDVVGLVTAASTAQGSSPKAGFALPVNRVLQVAEDIETGKSGKGIEIGTEAYLGIEGETVHMLGSGLSSAAEVAYVQPGTPAARAGLESDDVIIDFAGQAISTMEELVSIVHRLHPGARATVTFETPWGGTQTATVTLAVGPPA
jgi:S1-C subfamily serine protease